MAVTAAAKPGDTKTFTDEVNHLAFRTKAWWSAPFHGNSSPGLIAHYWLAAGGSPAHVNEAVAASLAESSGSAGAISGANSNGTRDVGLWQVNTVHGPSMASTDPLTNARAAVHLSKNGTDWSPWCTSYDDGICHGSTSNPHYRGAGRGNRMGGSAVLGQVELGFLYAKDAIAGAYYGAQSAGGTVAPLITWADPVTKAGATATDKYQLQVDSAITSATGGAWGLDSVGKVLAYAGYGLLAAFGASLMLGGLAVLVLALVDRHPDLAAITPVGRFAGAASEARAGASARGARNQSRGADSFRQSKAGRVAHGEPKATPKGRRKPTHGGQQGPRARRAHAGVQTNPRPRHGYQIGDSPGRGPTREQAGTPF